MGIPISHYDANTDYSYFRKDSRLTMLDRRCFQRTKVFKGAQLVLAGRSTIRCIVRDLSNHGACLQLTSTAGLPAEFDLTFDTGHTLRKCRIAWQNLTNVGVSFEASRAR
jgi:hypothetical protein